MKRAVPVLSGVCAALCIVLCLLHPESVLTAARDSFSLFVHGLLPALFPSFVLASVLTASGLPAKLGGLISPGMRKLGLPGEAGPLVILGAVSGYPVGAKLTAELYDRNEIDLPTAERLCAACNLAGPMFLSGTLAATILKSPSLGVVIMVSHWIGALAVLLIGALFRGDKTPASKTVPAPTKEFALVRTLLSAVAEGMLAMLRVCGAIMLFSVIIAALRVSGMLSAFCGTFSALGLDPKLVEAVVSGFFEKTTGAAAVSALPGLSLPVKAAFCSFFAAFGGCSILLQTLFFLPVRPTRYWGYKLIQSAVAAGATLLLAGG
ncbi:MAG: nucleoside recognition domain-containing protein [Christensenellales bacterium]|jgi:sporulation integral membrane protein YlbJ